MQGAGFYLQSKEVVMNSEEQSLIDGLFTRLQQAEAGSAPRDAQAQARINEHLARQPAATYYMAQALLVQEAALKQLDQQNKQLQAELAQAKAAAAPAPSGGAFCRDFLAVAIGYRPPRPAQRRAPGAGVMARQRLLSWPLNQQQRRRPQHWAAAFWAEP